jgi:hypothetical protein
MIRFQSGATLSTDCGEKPSTSKLAGVAGFIRDDDEHDTPVGSTRINTSLYKTDIKYL